MWVEWMLGVVLAQEGEKKAPAKEQAAPGPMLQVAEVDTNGDGWISAAELKAALAKLGGGRKEGDGVKKPGLRDGEGPKKPGPRDGEGPKKEGPRDGEKRPEGERKER